MSNREEQLASIRALTVEMATLDFDDVEAGYLELVEDILRQIRAGRAPDVPVIDYMRRRALGERD